MKRLALVALAAGFWPGSPIRGADTPCAPAPTQFAPTVPTVPPPTFCNGVIVPDGVGCESARARRFAWPKLFGLFDPCPAPCEPYDPCKVTRAGGSGGGKVIPAGGQDCGPGGCTGQKWECVKAWLCYRPSSVKLPLTPTPHTALPLFPCQPTAGAGCGPNACGPNGCAPGHGGQAQGGGGGGQLVARLAAATQGAGLLHPRGANGGTSAGANGVPPCDMSTPSIPGYRFAAAENHTITGKPYNPSVTQLAYKVSVGPVVKPPPMAPSLLGVPFTKP